MAAQARVSVFCGKGGVGKSTLSIAMGLKLASAGRRVLVVSSHPLEELAVAISLDRLEERFPEAAKRLFVVFIDPIEQITDLVETHFPLPMMARAVLNSSIFQNLIAVAPGLKEFFFLVRLQQLAERRAPERVHIPEYDDLIWDAPATGHFLSTLRAAKGFETYLSGPLAEAGAEMHRFFSAASSMRVAAVTQPEEMAITETHELCEGLRQDFGIVPATVILNAVSPVCMASAEDVDSLNAGAGDGALQFAIERGIAERGMCEALARDLPIRQVFVPRLAHGDGPHEDRDLDLLEDLGQYLDPEQLT